MKVFVTYGEILETVAVRIFNKLRSDPELRNNENIFFYRPKKKELFEYIYQTKLADLLVKEGLLTSEYAKKLARGDRRGVGDWRKIREEWLKLWEKCFGNRRYIVIGKPVNGDYRPLLRVEFLRFLKPKAYNLIRCVLKAYKEAVDKYYDEIKKKAKNYDIIVELHSGLGLKGEVGIEASNKCPPSVIDTLKRLLSKEFLYLGTRTRDFPGVTLEIFSNRVISPISMLNLPRPCGISKNKKKLAVLYRENFQVVSSGTIYMAYSRVKFVIKLLVNM